MAALVAVPRRERIEAGFLIICGEVDLDKLEVFGGDDNCTKGEYWSLSKLLSFVAPLPLEFRLDADLREFLVPAFAASCFANFFRDDE